MLNNVSRWGLVGAWCAAVIVLFACSVVVGVETSTSAGELWLVACLVPPSVMLLVWRTPAVTVAELLYATDESSETGRR